MALDPFRLGRRTRELRELRGVTLSAAADLAGVAKSYLSKLEKGEVENPGVRTLTSIARALETDLGSLLEYDPESARSVKARTPEWRKADQLERYDALRATAPSSFLEYLREADAGGRPVPADMAQQLLSIRVRGQQPATVDDWRFLHDALNRSVSR